MNKIPQHVAAVMAALEFRHARPEQLRDLNDDQWGKLLSFTDMMHLTLVLGQRCSDHLPPWVRSRISQNLADNIEHLRRLKDGYAEIKAALDEAAVEHIVLKGFSGWLGDAESSQYRMQSDIDLYCPPDSLLRARDVLAAIGFVTTRLSQYLQSDQHLPTMFRPSKWVWRGNYFDPEIPVAVDLHGCFWNPVRVRFGPEHIDQFWQRRVSGEFENFGYLTLCPIDGLAYSCLHALRHIICRTLLTHHLYEIAWFLHRRAHDTAFWTEWGRAHDSSLRSLEAIVFRFARDWFVCDLSPQAEREIQMLPAAVQRWFQHYSTSPLYALFQPNKQTLWLHLSLIESARDRRAVLWQGLVPTGVPPIAAFDNPPAPGESTSRSFIRKLSDYAAYVASRVRYHGTILPNTLWHGLRWWASGH